MKTFAPFIAAFVNDNAAQMTAQQLDVCLKSFLYAAFNTDNYKGSGGFSAVKKHLNKSPEMNIFVEGPGEGVTTDNVTIHRMTTGDFSKLITFYESGGVEKMFDKGAGKKLKKVANVPVYFLCVGSQAFCAAFIHFLATGREGACENWGIHFVRNLPLIREGKVIWMTSESDAYVGPPQFVVGDVTDIVEDALEHF